MPTCISWKTKKKSLALRKDKMDIKNRISGTLMQLFYHNSMAHILSEGIPEASHIICIDLDGGPTFQDREGITSEGKVFIIPPPLLISVG